jgi:hypothetical protein
MEQYTLDSSASGNGQVLGSCEQGNDPLDSIKCWQFLDKVCVTVCPE